VVLIYGIETDHQKSSSPVDDATLSLGLHANQISRYRARVDISTSDSWRAHQARAALYRTSMRMARRLNASASGDIRRDYGAFVAIFLNAYCVRGRGLDRRTQVTGRVWCTCHVCQVVGVRRVDGVRQKRPGRAAHPLTREPRAEAGVAWQPCICPTGRTYSRRARPCVACCRKRYRHR